MFLASQILSNRTSPSIENYECGAEPLFQLYKILLKAPGVYGARFSGAGFRGCCVAFVDAEKAEEATSYVKDEYEKAQPEFAKKLSGGKPVLICEAGDSARVLCSNSKFFSLECSVIVVDSYLFILFFILSVRFSDLFSQEIEMAHALIRFYCYQQFDNT
ncbi:BnaA01g31870D [Brassica napus]|uniref:BnaA01g31870D protein n=1 Tax=Brassica napus TaxID=3708 RepID=A0A078HU01_BRANA|nr:BnaA01g31870D [Brassica napus]